MSSLKEKMKVVMLPTEKAIFPSICIGTPELGLRYTNQPFGYKGTVYYHLYIVSNREIKEGDWYLSWETNYAESPKERFVIYNLVSKPNGFNPRKIEASTDKSLGLPQPSPDFVKKYVELQGSITEVMVEMEEMQTTYGSTWELRRENTKTHIVVKTDKNNYITITKVEETWDDIENSFLSDNPYDHYRESADIDYFLKWLKKHYKTPQKL